MTDKRLGEVLEHLQDIRDDVVEIRGTLSNVADILRMLEANMISTTGTVNTLCGKLQQIEAALDDLSGGPQITYPGESQYISR